MKLKGGEWVKGPLGHGLVVGVADDGTWMHRSRYTILLFPSAVRIIADDDQLPAWIKLEHEAVGFELDQRAHGSTAPNWTAWVPTFEDAVVLISDNGRHEPGMHLRVMRWPENTPADELGLFDDAGALEPLAENFAVNTMPTANLQK